ncbi:MAG TPA: hypothetical protein VG651_04325 [Stellaceae bacterium]|nr:hypothetical protein [Stellaceae bacterium]
MIVALGFATAAAAQDMPPIPVPLVPAPPPPIAVPVSPVPVSPSAEATLPPPAAMVPVQPPERHRVVAAAPHPAPAHHRTKFTALTKRSTASHHARPTGRHVAVRRPEPPLPPGMSVPPPGYYGPYDPGPYRRLVYAGPPPGFYGGWYRGPYPGYP